MFIRCLLHDLQALNAQTTGSLGPVFKVLPAPHWGSKLAPKKESQQRQNCTELC